MTNPSIKKQGSVIELHFEDAGDYQEKVTIKASRITELKQGIFTAEIKVFADFPVHGKRNLQIERTKANLLDSSAKQRLVMILNQASEQYGYLKWGSIINIAFDLLVDSHREGTPPVRMDNLTENNSPSVFSVYPFVVQGANNLIYADAGSGKSMFSLLTCVLVDRGMSRVGMRATKGNVLYCDYEESQSVYANRLLSLQKGLGLENPDSSNILWKRMDRNLPDEIDEIQRLVLENNITYVCIDSLSQAIQGSASEDVIISQYFSSLRSLGESVSTLTIDHTNKNKELFGSSQKMAQTRMMFELKKVDTYRNQDGNNVSEIALYWRKGNEFAPITPRAFEITYHDKEIPDGYSGTYTHMIEFDSMNLTDSDSALEHMDIVQICEELIRNDGQQKVDDLAKRISILKEHSYTPESIENLLRNAKSLDMNGSGYVGLKYHGSTE